MNNSNLSRSKIPLNPKIEEGLKKVSHLASLPVNISILKIIHYLEAIKSMTNFKVDLSLPSPDEDSAQ